MVPVIFVYMDRWRDLLTARRKRRDAEDESLASDA
jgi:hypothetical protein